MNETYLMWGIVVFCVLMFLLVVFSLSKKDDYDEPSQQSSGRLFKIKKTREGSWEGKHGDICFSGENPDSVISKINNAFGVRK